MNALIANVIIEESADFSTLISDLTGNYLAEDIEVKDTQGEPTGEILQNPYKDATALDFSGKIVFTHFNADHASHAGVESILINDFKGTKAWNTLFAYAKENNYSHLVILNNVNKINPHLIKEALESNVDKDIITLSEGAAFVVKCSSNFIANEEYNFWVEDNNIINKAREEGKLGGIDSEFLDFSQAELTDIKDVFLTAVTLDQQK
jgi:hypothetical protein